MSGHVYAFLCSGLSARWGPSSCHHAASLCSDIATPASSDTATVPSSGHPVHPAAHGDCRHSAHASAVCGGGGSLLSHAGGSRRWEPTAGLPGSGSGAVGVVLPHSCRCVRFYNREDVVHGPVPFGTPFFLIWKRWRRQSIASAGAFRYKVLLGLRGLPAHTWAGTPTRRAREDLRKYFVAAWCIHPRFIPQQKIIAIPESEVPFVVEPPLYLREHELIRSELPALRHLVRVRVVEVHDWTAPPPNDPDWLDRGQRGGSAPWPRRHRFGDAGGNTPDPQLGPGWGPTFREAPPVLVPCGVHAMPGAFLGRSLVVDKREAGPSVDGVQLSAPVSPPSSQASSQFEIQILSHPEAAPERVDPLLDLADMVHLSSSPQLESSIPSATPLEPEMALQSAPKQSSGFAACAGRRLACCVSWAGGGC